MSFPKEVFIKEVGPRDGLQNEKKLIPTEQKIAWIEKLVQTGLRYLEVTSFVHPKWIPQLADSEQVVKHLPSHPDVTYAALIPNRKGLERALDTPIHEFSVFMSASEGHNKRNINKTIDETYSVLEEVVKEGKATGRNIRGYVSTVFGCPYDGDVAVSQVVKVSERLLEMGVDELSLGDTIGVANPRQVQQVLYELTKYIPQEKIALHFHNTRGMALANVWAALEMGFTIFDSSLGGLGGCPYAKGASGNLATDDLNHMLESMGVETGIQTSQLMKAADFIQEAVGKSLPSHQMQIRNQMRKEEDNR
ncbi:hydroxymethylglutaryl-CoA lyase [Bacillaceae bacterium S4-13-58]